MRDRRLARDTLRAMRRAMVAMLLGLIALGGSVGIAVASSGRVNFGANGHGGHFFFSLTEPRRGHFVVSQMTLSCLKHGLAAAATTSARVPVSRSGAFSYTGKGSASTSVHNTPVRFDVHGQIHFTAAHGLLPKMTARVTASTTDSTECAPFRGSMPGFLVGPQG
jgi:hypothetical protein